MLVFCLHSARLPESSIEAISPSAGSLFCREQEELTTQAEERAARAEKELEESRERITLLESELQQLKSSTEQTSKGGLSGHSSRASTKGGRKVTRPGVGQPPSRSESRKRL